MPTEGFNDAVKAIDDEISYSTEEMPRGAKALLEELAELDGKTTGQYLSKLVWKDAKSQLSEVHILNVLKQDGIEYTPE